SFRVVASVDERTEVLRLRSLAMGRVEAASFPPAVPARRSFTRIVWDHSAVGDTVTAVVPRRAPVPIPLGSGGVFEPSELSALAALEPERAAAALMRGARAGADDIS